MVYITNTICFAAIELGPQWLSDGYCPGHPAAVEARRLELAAMQPAPQPTKTSQAPKTFHPTKTSHDSAPAGYIINAFYSPLKT